MVLTQAVSVAEAYIEEITLKPYANPDGVDGETACTAYDDVDDYDGLVDVTDLDTTHNAGASYFAEAQYVTPHEYVYCSTTGMGTCGTGVGNTAGPYNNYNNASYRKFTVAGTTSFSFTPAPRQITHGPPVRCSDRRRR